MWTTVSQTRLTDQLPEFTSTMGRPPDLVSDPEVTIGGEGSSEAGETTEGGEEGVIMDIEMITMIEGLHHRVIMTEAMIGMREITMLLLDMIAMRRESDIPEILEIVITSLTGTETIDIGSQDQVVDILLDQRTGMEGVEDPLPQIMRGTSTIRTTRETGIMIGMRDHPVIITPAEDLLALDLLAHLQGEITRGVEEDPISFSLPIEYLNLETGVHFCFRLHISSWL